MLLELLHKHSIDIQNEIIEEQERQIAELQRQNVPPDDDRYYLDCDDLEDDDEVLRDLDIVDENGNLIQYKNYSIHENERDLLAEAKDKLFGVIDENDLAGAERVARKRYE